MLFPIIASQLYTEMSKHASFILSNLIFPSLSDVTDVTPMWFCFLELKYHGASTSINVGLGNSDEI